MGNEFHQLRHARTTNAKLFPLERYALYRHDVEKLVEPGAPWQPFGAPASGVPFEQDPRAVAPFVRAALDRVLGRDVAVPALPSRVERCFLTLYVSGAIKGCAGGRDLQTLVDAVWADSRFGDKRRAASEVAVCVSFLTESERWGEAALVG